MSINNSSTLTTSAFAADSHHERVFQVVQYVHQAASETGGARGFSDATPPDELCLLSLLVALVFEDKPASGERSGLKCILDTAEAGSAILRFLLAADNRSAAA